MKVRLAIIQDVRHVSGKGVFPIKLRITYLTKQYYYHTGVSISEKDFKRMNQQKDDQSANYTKVNELYLKADGILKKMKGFDLEKFREKMDDETPSDTVEYYFKKQLSENPDYTVGTINGYDTALNSLQRFFPGLQIQELTKTVLKQYSYKLRTSPSPVTGKPLSDSSVSMYLRCIKSVINNAIDDGKYTQGNPFSGKKPVEVPESDEKKNPVATADKDKLESFVTSDKDMAYARDMWLMCFYCGGRNVVDILYLKYGDITENSIVFKRRTKTKKKKAPKTLNVPLHSGIRRILKDYSQKKVTDETFVFNEFTDDMDKYQLKNKTQDFCKKCNAFLRIISEQLGIIPIKLQQARHTAVNELYMLDTPIEEISQTLQHDSIETTKIYLKSLPDIKVNEALNKLAPKNKKLRAVK